MSQLYMNYPSHWNSHEQQISDSLSKSLSLGVDFSAQLCNNSKNPGLQMQDDSSSSQSTQSNHDLTGAGGSNSQDQCNSSESGQDVSCDNRVEGQIKHVFMMGQSDMAINQHQANYGQTMTCLPYACADPYYTTGLASAYGATPIIQPQMLGGGPARVPLPLDFTEDEPIYVNAKQYHGILRRRQSRAKLEAQNKLIKARKPYLHESRHIHAMNRVRGSGGRFLSTKKLQQEAHSKANGSRVHPNSVQYHQHNGSSSSSSAPHLSFNFTDLSNGGYSGFINTNPTDHCARVVQ